MSTNFNIRIIVVVMFSTTFILLPFFYLDPILVSKHVMHGIEGLHLSAETATYSLSFKRANSSLLLLLFTTFKNSSDKNYIHVNTAKNWALLLPYVQPLLFTTFSEGPLLDVVKENGWWVEPVPKVNTFGTPHLKEMYLTAWNLTRATFYGFANADILFTRGMLETLQAVVSMLPQLNRTMVIGRRTNFVVNITKKQPLFEHEKLMHLARKRGHLYRPDAEDYFFIAHFGFPWEIVPDVVIGRPAYDNFMVATAIANNMSVVDATNTLLAFHQTGKDGNAAGGRNKDAQYNKKVIGLYEYFKGITDLSQYISSRDSDGNVVITRRHKPKPKPI